MKSKQKKNLRERENNKSTTTLKNACITEWARFPLLNITISLNVHNIFYHWSINECFSSKDLNLKQNKWLKSVKQSCKPKIVRPPPHPPNLWMTCSLLKVIFLFLFYFMQTWNEWGKTVTIQLSLRSALIKLIKFKAENMNRLMGWY